jgi:hypothetical protein
MTARRHGGVPPLVTVLITLSAIVAAGLVAWFLFTTTSSAAKTPVLEVTGAYATGTTLKFTVRNVGSVAANNVALASPTCSSGGTLTPQGCTPNSLNPGQSAVCTITGSSSFADGSSCTVELSYTTPSGNTERTLLAFRVAVP